MPKKTLSRILSVVLTVAVLLSALVITVNAETKIDLKLSEALKNPANTGGLVVEITHHNPNYPIQGVTDDEAVANNLSATAQLCEKISELTYAEVLWFDIGKLYVGLPYSSIEKVAELDTVDKIAAYEETAVSTQAPADKISSELAKNIEELSPETSINISVVLSYTPAVYYGFSEEDYDDPQDYVDAKREVNSQYYTEKNQKYFDIIKTEADIELSSISKFTPALYLSTTVSQIENLSELTQIASIEYVPATPIEQPTEQPSNKEKCKDKFSEIFGLPDSMIDEYEELFYHYDSQNSLDWVIIHVKTDLYSLWEVVRYGIFGDRYLQSEKDYLPYPLLYGVYDAKEEKFYSLEDAWKSDKYSGLHEAFESLDIGRIIGDIDNDGKLTVVDATVIQKCLSKMIEWPSYDEVGESIGCYMTYNTKISYLSDYDRDGQRTVMDSTAIQKRIAKLEEIK